MTFAKMMAGIRNWDVMNHHVNDAFPLKVTFEVGNVELASQLLLSLKAELEPLLMVREGNTLAIALDEPFRYMGMIVEIKLRPRAPDNPARQQQIG
jgi:hypothetical protein